MRSDFDKLLCERPRRGGHNADEAHYKRADGKLLPYRDYEEWASGGKMSMKKHFSGKSRKTKHLNENLSPLMGFLTKSCGKKWDEVYSEICRSCSKNSAVGAHVFQHLFDYVEIYPVLDEETGIYYRAPHKTRKYGKSSLIWNTVHSSGRNRRYYVDSAGILQPAPQRSALEKLFSDKKNVERESFELRIDSDRWAVRMGDNRWYWAYLTELPEIGMQVFEVTHADGTVTQHERPYWYIFDQYRCNDLCLGTKSAIGWFHLNSSIGTKQAEKLVTRRKNEFREYYGSSVYCWKLVSMTNDEIRRHVLAK